MIRIAIVEDEKKSVQLLQHYIDRYAKEKQEKITIESFENGLDFITDYKACYDIVLMDIEMPQMNGLETARKLRELDSQVCLIFITNMSQYAINGYEVQALDFMVKPVEYFNLSLKLNKAVKLCRRNNSCYLYIPSDQGIIRLNASELIYAESVKHYLYLHTEKDTYKIRGKMDELLSKLPSGMFACCSQSYCVNLGCVSSFRTNSVQINGIELSISRTYKKSFINQMTTYINRGGI